MTQGQDAKDSMTQTSTKIGKGMVLFRQPHAKRTQIADMTIDLVYLSQKAGGFMHGLDFLA